MRYRVFSGAFMGLGQILLNRHLAVKMNNVIQVAETSIALPHGQYPKSRLTFAR